MLFITLKNTNVKLKTSLNHLNQLFHLKELKIVKIYYSKFKKVLLLLESMPGNGNIILEEYMINARQNEHIMLY